MTGYQPPVPVPSAEESCSVCGTTIPSMGNYCPRCGAIKPSMRFSGIPPPGNRRTWTWPTIQYQPVARTNWRRVGKSITAFVMLTFVAQLVLSIITLVYGVKWVAPAIIDEWHGFNLILVLPVIIEFWTISGYSLLVFYFFLIGAIVASCTWVFVTSIRGFSKELSMTATPREHSALFETCGLMFATLFFSVIVALILRTSSSEVPSTGTLQESLFLLANASVWEELVVRVLLIGLPLLLVNLYRRNQRNEWRSYLLGGGFKLGVPETVLVIVSSAIFGYAHFASGWGAWKILPASVGGLAFGYLFLRYGLVASIVLHFGTDYLGMPIEVFNSTGLTLITGLGILVWLGFGAIFFVYYTSRVAEFLAGRRLFVERQVPTAAPWAGPSIQSPVQSPVEGQYAVVQPGWNEGVANTPHPPPYYGFSGGYVCPRCSHTQARWINGRFQCMNCGFLT